MKLNSILTTISIMSCIILCAACSDNSVPTDVHKVIFEQSNFSIPLSLDPCDGRTREIEQPENVAHRELISIDYTNKYEKNIDLPVTVYALTFTYRITHELPELPQLDEVFNGEGVVELNPNNGRLELQELKLGDSGEDHIIAIIHQKYNSHTESAPSEKCIISRVSNELNLSGAVKLAVAETYSALGKFYGSNAGYGVPAPTEISGNYILSVSAGNEGKITVTYNNRLGDSDANNRTIIFTPKTKFYDPDKNWSYKSSDQYWECRGGTMPDRFRPQECRKK